MKKALTIVLFFSVITGFSQIPQKYFVAFTDKNGTPYSISDPQAFLTQRAIDRRTKFGIPITEEDLPVNPAYVSIVAALGAQVFTVSKWFNGVTVRIVDSATYLPQIRALSFVKSVTRVTAYNSKKSGNNDKFRIEEELPKVGSSHGPLIPGSAQSYDYGPSHGQIHLLKGDVLHNQGYRGQGIVIAVLDSGFQNADVTPVFDSLRTNNQILGTRDFVTPGGNVYQEHWHGGSVLSTMGGNIPGQLIGTAPKASYWLIRTEDANTENIIEEYNWVVGAEMADSVGADVINSSLGYTTFDNDWMDHTCADMNGYTNPSSRGANIAANKGIALSISAGNEGGSGWLCVSSPSDAINALSIAAVDSLGNYAYFSSTGTIDTTYVKPNIASDGWNSWVAYPDSSLGYGSGTSFASPINAGVMACFIQAKPDLTPSQLYLAIEKSATQYTDPDTLLGYGIPDYSKALVIAQAGNLKESSFRVYPNPFSSTFTISTRSNISGNVEISLISITGEVILKTNKSISAVGANTVRISNLGSLAPGMYIVKISAGSTTEYLHIVKIAN
ncbi:MAG: S8/S53 family peptidase [Bacteroidales bacterium]|jgi:hypothetical protein